MVCVGEIARERESDSKGPKGVVLAVKIPILIASSNRYFQNSGHPFDLLSLLVLSFAV